ncbi:hypothetical protein V5740_01775 [Croceibacterium sp. TMG7-5b_MA50]|uniref:hypothetical protein n=1 Tax=Croceibacterium sp. TMG7-5b_MA50 TaxID=3121290 RepID=UPI0032219C07
MALTILQGAVVGTLALAVPAGGYWLNQLGSTDVRFLRGTDTTTLAGSVEGDGSHDYRVRARAGQVLEVALDGSPLIAFDVLVPGDGEPIASGSGAQDIRQNLVKGGAYTIRVHHQPGADDRGNDPFALKVRLHRPTES